MIWKKDFLRWFLSCSINPCSSIGISVKTLVCLCALTHNLVLFKLIKVDFYGIFCEITQVFFAFKPSTEKTSFFAHIRIYGLSKQMCSSSETGVLPMERRAHGYQAESFVFFNFYGIILHLLRTNMYNTEFSFSSNMWVHFVWIAFPSVALSLSNTLTSPQNVRAPQIPVSKGQ